MVFEFVETWNKKDTANINGFYIKPNVIVLKRQQKSFRREIFTLIHELGHYLLNEEEIEEVDVKSIFRKDLSKIENWCNEFSYFFLIGNNANIIENLKKADSSNDYHFDIIQRISRETNLSTLALYTRLLYSKKISYKGYNNVKKELDELYRKKIEEENKKKEIDKLSGIKRGGSVPKPINSPLFVNILQTALYGGVINEYDFCKKLNIKPEKIGLQNRLLFLYKPLGIIKMKTLLIIIFGIFICSCTTLKQETNGNKNSDSQIENDLKELSVQIDSIAKGKYGRSAFLDRGLGENFKLYDSLEFVFYQKLGDYLKLPISLKKSKSLIGNTVHILEKGNKKIYQWEYISGGTQQNIRKYIQIVHLDSIEVYKDDSDYWTYQMNSFDNDFLEFESKKGCATCCEERIIYKGQEIYSIKYRNRFIEQLFTFDKDSQNIKIKLENVYSEGENDDDFEILNKTLILNYNGEKFMEQK